MAIKCEQCGASLTDGDGKFCKYCGAKLPETEDVKRCEYRFEFSREHSVRRAEIKREREAQRQQHELEMQKQRAEAEKRRQEANRRENKFLLIVIGGFLLFVLIMNLVGK